jgi:hypothetical protein
VHCVPTVYLVNTAGRFYENWCESYISGSHINDKPHSILHSVITLRGAKNVGSEPYQLYEPVAVIGYLV